jgi:hypothetical protein
MFFVDSVRKSAFFRSLFRPLKQPQNGRSRSGIHSNMGSTTVVLRKTASHLSAKKPPESAFLARTLSASNSRPSLAVRCTRSVSSKTPFRVRCERVGRHEPNRLGKSRQSQLNDRGTHSVARREARFPAIFLAIKLRVKFAQVSWIALHAPAIYGAYAEESSGYPAIPILSQLVLTCPNSHALTSS